MSLSGLSALFIINAYENESNLSYHRILTPKITAITSSFLTSAYSCKDITAKASSDAFESIKGSDNSGNRKKYTLKITLDNIKSNITGKITNAIYEKDRREGRFKEHLREKDISAVWTYMQEGVN